MGLDTTALAATLQDRQQGFTDEISAAIPLFWFLKKKGQYVSTPGGNSFEFNVEYLLDTTEPSFAGYDTLPVFAQDSVQTAKATFKNYHKVISLNGEEEDLNMGRQVFKLLAQKEANAITSIQQQMNDHFYLDGTANGGKRITGLAAIIDPTPTTGTLFDIDRSVAANAFFRNQFIDMNDGAFQTTAGTFTLRKNMDDMWVRCGRQRSGKGKNFPDLILCTEGAWRVYSEGMDLRGQRFTNTMSADAGFTSLEFNGATMIMDEDMPDDAGSDDQMYFINSAWMQLRYIASANFKLGKSNPAESQDAFSKRLIWRGELISQNPQKLGLLEGIKAVEAS